MRRKVEHNGDERGKGRQERERERERVSCVEDNERDNIQGRTTTTNNDAHC